MARWKIILPIALIVPVVIIAIVLIVVGVGSSSSEGSIIETQVGLIRGVRASDGDYYMYMGIPYAKVDEDNPFGPSSPYPVFEEIFEADDDSIECPHVEQFNMTAVGSLDCLRLHIYVPITARSRNQMPVLVWFHGGGFVIGSGSRFVYGPKFIVDHDVILVTLNYRLGPYGFMCTDIPEVPGNQGLKDQSIALRWIKDNIDSFGGDANKITIFGESAGAMSVDLHLYSAEEKLFNRVIMQSGTALLSSLVGQANNGPALTLAEELGYETTDVRAAIAYLSTLETNEVVGTGTFGFMACVENEFENVERFIHTHPINQNIPKAEGIQVLIGYNSDEAMLNYAHRLPETYTENEFRTPLFLAFNFDTADLIELEAIVRHFYIGGEEISIDQIFDIVDFQSDLSFVHPTERSIAKYKENGAEKIYYYMFSYVGDRNYYRRRNNITIGGAVHADELSYLFDVELFREEPTPEDQRVIDQMTTMWTNFAKYGDPTPDTSDLLPVKWEPITSSSPHYYLDIDSELSLGRRPFHRRVSFWDLFFKHNGHLQRGYVPNNEL